MKTKVSMNGVYARSENLVAREVQGEFIIIPIASGIGDLGDEIFSFNATGKKIWDALDGKKSLKDIAAALSLKFKEDAKVIERDVRGLATELLKKRMLVPVKNSKK